MAKKFDPNTAQNAVEVRGSGTWDHGKWEVTEQEATILD